MCVHLHACIKASATPIECAERCFMQQQEVSHKMDCVVAHRGLFELVVRGDKMQHAIDWACSS